MAQIIKHKRGSLEKLSSITGSLQKGEIVIATGSANLNVTNGEALVFAAYESGSIAAVNRVLRGANDPAVFAGSTYNGMLNGVPYYSSGSKTLFLLGSDGNEAIDLSGNVIALSGSIANDFSSSNYQISQLSASVASTTGDFSSSVASQFSASAASVTSLSASVATDLNNLSSSISTTDSASAASVNALSASTYNAVFGFAGLSSSVATTISASAASATNANNILSASIATSFSASAASQTNLSSSLATTISASAATAASDNANLSSSLTTTISNLSSSIATTDSASAAYQTALSASIATTVSNLSSSIATTDSASVASQTALSASIATDLNNLSSSVATTDSGSKYLISSLSASTFTNSGSVANRLNVIETTYATTGSNTFNGNQVISGSMWITGDVTIYGSSSLVNVTASAVEIGTNTIVLNTANPAVRFGGIAVIDSGSNSNATGSLLWDSTNNVWIYVNNPDQAGYTSARLIAGPQNTGSVGEETGLYTNYLTVASGDDHISSSNISVIGNDVTIEQGGNLYVDGEISSSTINGIGNVTDFSASVSASLAAINNNLGAGGDLGTRVSNLETISSSYLAFTQSYYSDSASFDTRISASAYNITALSASTAMVAGDFSASVATSFSASAANVTALSSSVASDLNNLSSSVASDLNNASSSAFSTFAKLAGGNTFTETQTFSNDVNVNGTTNFNNAVAVNDANMNLGNSSALNLSNGASIYVDASGTISGSITGIGNVSEFSTSVDSRFSASAYDVAVLSASVASVGGTFSSSVATTISNLSSSIATTDSASAAYAASQLNSVSGAVATTISNLSSSVATTISASLATVSFDSSSLETSITNLSSSVATSFSASAANVNALSASIATSDSASAAYAASQLNSVSGAVATTISNLSSSIATTDSASAAYAASQLSSVSSSVATDLNNLSSSVATSFSASAANVNALSASIATTDSASLANVNAVSNSIVTDFSASQHTQNVRLDSIEAYTSSLQNAISVSGSGTGSTTTILGNLSVQGTTTIVDSTTVSIGDNIIALNGTQAAYAGIQVADPTNPSKVSGSLLWDSANDMWIAGPIGSEVQLADINYVSTSVASLSQSAATSFSASNYTISQLSASVASVTGDFSSSVATSFSASAFNLNSVSASIVNDFSASQYVQDGRLSTLEGTGTIQGVGTTNDVTFNSVTASNSVNIPSGGGNSKRLAFRGLTDNIEFIAAPQNVGDIAQWDGTDFVMSNTIDGGSF